MSNKSSLKQIPGGEKFSMNELTKRTNLQEILPQETTSAQEEPQQEGAKPLASINVMRKGQTPSYETVKPMLTQYTCTSCHDAQERKVGPPFAEIAERGYSEEEMVELMYNPDLSNWPDYATAMPPMTIVPEERALQIAEWINSLK